MVRLKIYRIAVLALSMVVLSGAAPLIPVHAKPEALYTNAKASALIDVTSGRLLWSDNGDEQLRIASLTKIMTAIVAIEHGNLKSNVKTGIRAAGKEGSSIYLQVGEEMSLLNMLYGLMLRSGNDAATAIAEHVGGSEEGFVYLMNQKAIAIGLHNTQFQNPSGLDAEGHYSSANDLAKLTAYALRNKTFAQIVSTEVKKVPNPHEDWDYSWKNKNKMLNMYEGADGVKTGYTKKALRCLVSSATRNGQQIAAVTINDGDDWRDHKKMLDWGFKHYPLKQLIARGDVLTGHTLAAGNSFKYPLTEEEEVLIQPKLRLLEAKGYRYELGERGALEWYLNDSIIGRTPVYERNSIRMKLTKGLK